MIKVSVSFPEVKHKALKGVWWPSTSPPVRGGARVRGQDYDCGQSRQGDLTIWSFTLTLERNLIVEIKNR